MLFILCVGIGAFTGFAAAKLIHKEFRIWPQVAAGLAGSMFGVVLLEALDSAPAASSQVLMAAFLGAVAALALAHSLRTPMGVG